MKKNTIKLNENALRKIVADSVKKVLKEEYEERFNSFLGDENYMETIKNCIAGMNNTIAAMEDEGNKKSYEAVNYLVRQFEEKQIKLNQAWSAVKSTLMKK